MQKFFYKRNQWKKFWKSGKIFFSHIFIFSPESYSHFWSGSAKFEQKNVKNEERNLNSIFKKMAGNKRTRKLTKKLIQQKNQKAHYPPWCRPNLCLKSVRSIFFQQKKEENMEKCCCIFYFLHFENTFLELITNLTFMQNLKKIAPKMKAWIPFENVCHLRKMCPFNLFHVPQYIYIFI